MHPPTSSKSEHEPRKVGPLVLAIDQGTTGTTAMVLDEHAEPLHRVTVQLPQHFPQPGWVEHDLEEIWSTVLEAIGSVADRLGPSVHDICAIGLTNQRETWALWQRADSRPVARALVWQDRRTAATCAGLRDAGHESQIRASTGLVLDPYFSATKAAWLCDAHPRVRSHPRDYAAGTIDSFLTWRLSGSRTHATDVSNASRTSLWPLDGACGPGWSEDLCELFNVPREILPEIRASNAHFGVTHGVPGLPDGIPIHGIAGDQQAATFGQACFDAGMSKCTYGTGGFLMLNTGSRRCPSKHGLLTTVGWQLGEARSFCLEGSTYMAGAVVQWLRDGLGIIEDAGEVEALARSVEDTGGVVLVPAHAGLGAPHWRADARGAITGLTRGSNRGHIARAALEGIALQITDLLEAMAADFGPSAELATKASSTSSSSAPSVNVRRIRVDGGAAANDLLMQMQSDFSGVTLERPAWLETTALGAGLLAGLGIGLWSDLGAIERRWRSERVFCPSDEAAKHQQIEQIRQRWREAVQKA